MNELALIDIELRRRARRSPGAPAVSAALFERILDRARARRDLESTLEVLGAVLLEVACCMGRHGHTDEALAWFARVEPFLDVLGAERRYRYHRGLGEALGSAGDVRAMDAALSTAKDIAIDELDAPDLAEAAWHLLLLHHAASGAAWSWVAFVSDAALDFVARSGDADVEHRALEIVGRQQRTSGIERVSSGSPGRVSCG